MAENAKMVDLQLTLKPFYQRASEAEKCGNVENTGNEENLKVINDLQSKLKAVNAESISEKEKIRMLEEENAKLQYRIVHLVRSLKETNLKLEQATVDDQLQNMKL
ncbi:unnamed protein product [Sphenostylis stenocarpa]|uniref:Uncharacterized protein n=1 Tax=Sphenostylis stenocarpa TaxID=92480 RepID=A0AA86VZN5_9FABA|nr:unnamed protein product [Sphenostylis stenocarpa]